MNEYMTRFDYGGPGWSDPGLWDTRLTERGQREAAESLRRLLAEAHAAHPIELCVASPLTRAMATAHLGLGALEVPRMLTPLLAERRYLSSDVGRPAAVLASEFPLFFPAPGDAEILGEQWWWRESPDEPAAGGPPGASLAVEPDDSFVRRMREVQDWIKSRQETRIAAVAHWGVWYSLLGGLELANCEMVEVDLDELISFWDKFPLKPPP